MQCQLVSILMPAYNSENTISESIGSVLEQTYQNWELIIIDDGSSDRTADIVEAFKDERIFLIRQKNCGVCCARNRGLSCARGEWIAFLDSDDIWVESKLERQLRHLNDRKCKFSYSRSYSFANSSNNIKKAFSFVNLVYDFIPTLTVVMHRSIFDVVGCFDGELNAAEDWDLWIRVLQKYQPCPVDEYLAKYRVSDSGLSGDLCNHHIEETKVFKKHISKYNKTTYRYRIWFHNKKEAIIALKKQDYLLFLWFFARLLYIPGLLIKYTLNKYEKRS